MKVKQAGGSAAVIVDGVGRVERGATIEVDEQLGKQLVEQGWKKVGGSSSSGKKGRGKKASTSRRRKSPSTTTSSPSESSAAASSPPAPPATPDPAAS